MKPDPKDLTQEVRFAIVLYGGVSLAIYINGVVQELRRLIRSTAKPYDELDPMERVYRKLGQALARGEVPTQQPSDDTPVRTRFRIDVISGTSAGGINGVFLAKALANESSLQAVENLWFQEGALEKLLNDKQSYADLAFAQPRDTDSLLNSARMYSKLLDAFDGMDKTNAPKSSDPCTSELVDELSLFATTTDIEGMPLPIQLADNVVYERRYRNVFRFRYTSCDVAGQPRNDFLPEYNPFLAFASRCTSSFPFAFQPMRLCQITNVLERNPLYKDKLDATKPNQYCGPDAERWHKFFRQYLVPSDIVTTPFAQRSFGDGGYLDNKPFSYAIDSLIECESDLPIDRKLFYVEPSPEHPEMEPPRSAPPNAIENSVDALISIPGYETIRGDLLGVLERNRLVTRARKTTLQIEKDIERDPVGAQTCQSYSDLEDMTFINDEHAYRPYYRLRITDITDQLATAIARAYDIDEGSDRERSLRSFVRAWREAEYDISGDHPRLADFLRDFDLPYRLRRLRFVLRKLDAYGALAHPVGHPDRNGAESAARFAGIPVSADSNAALLRELRAVRPQLAAVYRQLVRLRRSLLSVEEDPSGPAGKGAGASASERGTDTPRGVMRQILGDRARLEAALDAIVSVEPMTQAQAPRTAPGSPEADWPGAGPYRADRLTSRPLLRTAKDPASEEDMRDTKAKELLARDADLRAALKSMGEELSKRLSDVLGTSEAPDSSSGAHATARSLLGPNAENQLAARALRPFYNSFDLFDCILFPMLYGTSTGEGETVEIIRISPEDAASLVPDIDERRKKLRGLVVAHFGAFLDRSWRENDLLWGRLDAAERVISTLLPFMESRTLRDELIDEAQTAIIADFQTVTRLADMARARIAGRQPNVRLDATTATALVNTITAAPAGDPRTRNQTIMRIWRDLVPSEMDRRTLLEDLARSSQIVGRVLDQIGAQKDIPQAAVWLTRGGRILWALAELAVPRSAWQVASQYWAQLLYLVAIVLIVGGTIGAQAGVSQIGWNLLGGTFIVHLTLLWLRSFMRGKGALQAFKEFMLFLVAGAAVVLVILGMLHSWFLTDRVLQRMSFPVLGARGNRAVVNGCFAVAVPILAWFIAVISGWLQRRRST